MTFGQRLKNLMEEHNLTQRQLSHNLNIAASTLNGYANDYREPDFKTLEQIASYFQVSTDYMLGFSDTPKLMDISMDDNAQRLFHYYQQLSPGSKALLIDQAKLLQKYDLPSGK